MGRQIGLGERHDALSDVRPQWPDTRRSRLVPQEAVVPFLHETLLPTPDVGLRFACPAHDLIGANTVHAQQDALGPPDMLAWGVAIPRERLQTARISELESNGNSGFACARLACVSPLGIPLGDFKCQMRSNSLLIPFGRRGHQFGCLITASQAAKSRARRREPWWRVMKASRSAMTVASVCSH
jgi:hypothetical protein